MKWNPLDTNDYRIVAVSRWKSIDNYSGLEARAGVYIFSDVNYQLKYVGKAGLGRMVEEIADALRRSKDYGATQLKALYTNSDDYALSLEGSLIDKYDPPNNLR